MRRARLFSLLSLLLALPGCLSQPKGLLLVTPAKLYAPALASGTLPAPLEAYTLQGQASLFGRHFVDAHVIVSVLGKGEIVAEATVAADGTFSVSLPAGLPADAVLKVMAVKDGQSLTSLAPVPSTLLQDDLTPKKVLLTVDSTVSYRVLSQRLEASGQVSDDGHSNRVAYAAFSRLTDSFSGLINESSDLALQRAVLNAITPGLSSGALAALGAAASPAQHSAFIGAATQMAESLREALKSAGNPAVDSSLLGSLKLGISSVSPVFPSGSTGSNNRPTPSSTPAPTPFVGSAGLNIAPLPGGFSDPGAGPTVHDILSTATFAVGSNPRALGLDADGNVWIANQNTNNVTRISATGSLSTFTVGTTPRFLTVDASGNAWVANQTSSNVTRISATGSLSTFPVGAIPRGLAADAGGNVWVANYNSNNVTRISSTGSISTFAAGTNPRDVTVDSANNIWVSNFTSNDVTRISSTGSISTFPVGANPLEVAVDAGGNAWVASQASNNATRISATGSLSTFALSSVSSGVAVDAGGSAWILNQTANSVTRISSTGSLATFPVGANPIDIDIDAAGNVWVANNSSANVTRISSTGEFTTFPVGTTPVVLKVDANGKAWVANSGSNNATSMTY